MKVDLFLYFQRFTKKNRGDNSALKRLMNTGESRENAMRFIATALSVELFGGKEAFTSKLNENFEGNHYRHDNEPGHHYAYLFNYAGQPWKTQELIRKHTSEENYRNAPLGINGNDDCGQMSAWYVFGVMGFYPVTPGTEVFAIGAPQFPEFNLKLKHNGKMTAFTIVAKNLSKENMYVQSLKLDGKRLDKPFITYTQIMNGSNLVFEMGPTPNFTTFK